MGNIFKNLPQCEQFEESFEKLLSHKNISIERIVSKSFKNGSWMLQNHDEWVVLLKGDALLEFKDRNVSLKSGDYILIKSHEAHRVLNTSESALWLAIHIT